MKKIFMVKKNPELPGSEDNWIIMNGFEFAMFMQTEEGKARKKDFGRLDAASEGDSTIIIECGQSMARELQSEREYHYRLVKNEIDSGYKTYSLDEPFNGEDDDADEKEIIADENVNVEDEAILGFMKSELKKAVMLLNIEDQDLINSIWLNDNPISQSEYARLKGLKRWVVEYRNNKILKDLETLLTKK